MRAPGVLASAVTLAALAATGAAVVGGPGAAATSSEVDTTRPVPEVLAGDTWLRHLRDDLLPYWEMPVALGTPLGNFPTWRDAEGNLDPERGTFRGLATLARGVYGYSVAFHLTGDEKYLTYARAGLEWIMTKGYDATHKGWYRDLTETGDPRAPRGEKPIFDLASLGMAYGMYFNVTREHWAEERLLAIRDLIFDKYGDPGSDALVDAMSFDMNRQIVGNNGYDITNLLVPGTALLLPNADLLTDPARRSQFRDDLRTVTNALIDQHRNTGHARDLVVLGALSAGLPGAHRGTDRLRTHDQEPRADPQRQPGPPGPSLELPGRRPRRDAGAGVGRPRRPVVRRPGQLRPRGRGA